MDYKKILVILLSIINIAIVLALLIKPSLEIKENFNSRTTQPHRCLGVYNTIPVEATTSASPNRETDPREFFCNKFVIIFLVNEPDTCVEDSRVKQVYDDFFIDDNGNENNLNFRDAIIRKFNYSQLETFIADHNGLVKDDLLTELTDGKTVSPYIIIKKFNSVVLEIHNRGSFFVGGGLNMQRYLNIDSRQKAIDYINALKCQHAAETERGGQFCSVPDTCTVNLTPTTAAGSTGSATATTNASGESQNNQSNSATTTSTRDRQNNNNNNELGSGSNVVPGARSSTGPVGAGLNISGGSVRAPPPSDPRCST